MTDIIHDPGNTQPIETIYAYLTIDDQGRHGIVAAFIPNLGSTPLVTGSRQNAKNMQPAAERVAKLTDKRVGLFAFDLRAGAPLWEAGK